MMFSLDFRAHSEVGLVRKNNQDSAYASPNLLVVADGMGGAAAGDLASAVAISEISRADRRLEGEEMLSAFCHAVQRANDVLAELIDEDSSLEGMGTTVTGAMFSGTQLGLVHIGDSRGYLLRDGQLQKLTHDHSWVQSLVDEGRLNEADMATHPHRSLLLRVLNGQPIGDPDTAIIDLVEGDRLLFCSDGLSGFTTEAQMARVLRKTSLDDAVPQLVDLAHHGGGADNITFVVADVVASTEALDAVAPVLLGAVTDTKFAPSRRGGATPAAGAAGSGPHWEDDESDDDEEDDQPDRVIIPVDHERLRYEPTKQHHRWLSTILLLGAVVVVLVLVGVAGVAYARTQYYVGAATTTSGEHVAIFQGLPDSVLGVSLSRVEEIEDTLVSDLPRYYRDQVHGTISADSLDSARVTTHQLQLLAQQCIAQRTTKPQPSPSPSPRPSADASARATGSASAHASASTSRSSSSGRASASARATASVSAPTARSATPTATPSVPAQEDCS
ncbi:MAG TPA: protein phosphatase 2C domain-containing protein [Propionibacteriaceae bacterium]|nr:protein phosphatase 2C domain-containing protein [Propionibacteriaceae bacterium]